MKNVSQTKQAVENHPHHENKGNKSRKGKFSVVRQYLSPTSNAKGSMKYLIWGGPGLLEHYIQLLRKVWSTKLLTKSWTKLWNWGLLPPNSIREPIWIRRSEKGFSYEIMYTVSKFWEPSRSHHPTQHLQKVIHYVRVACWDRVSIFTNLVVL